MSDFEREYLVRDAVQEFRDEALPYVRASGTDAAWSTVRRRRRVRTAALVTAVVVLVLAPVAAFAAIGGGLRHQPPPAGRAATPSPSPSTTPSSVPSSAPASDAPLGAPPAADTPTNLTNATIVVDRWDPAYRSYCATGRLKFRNGVYHNAADATVRITQTVAVDVDHDGGTETAALLHCEVGEAGGYQVVVVKAGADGSLTTLGQVMHSDAKTADIAGMRAGQNGQLRLTVGDIKPCCDVPKSLEVEQVRTFAWNGSAFIQVAGRKTFIANTSIADLTVSAPALNFGPKVDGVRAGTLTLSVHNKGPRAATHVSLLLDLPSSYLENGVGGDWAKCPQPPGDHTRLCTLGTIAAGATVTLRLPFATVADASFIQPASAWNIQVQPRLDDTKYPTVTVKVTFD